MRKSPLWTVGLVAGLCLGPAFVQGCALFSSLPEHITLFVSGDSRGYLEPCGCRRDQAGGLSGRASVIRGSKAPVKLVLDVGNLTPGSRPYELLKLRYLLDGMEKIGYDAVNLGRTDAELDMETLRKALGEARLPYVSANVWDRASARPVVERYRILKRGKLRIGITGVTRAGGDGVGPGLDVRPPVEALAEIIPVLKQRCDFLIVLAFVDEEALKEIAGKFHEVHCVLGGDVPQSSNSVQEVNRALVFSVVDKGKVLGSLELKRSADRYVVDRAEGVKIVRDRLPEDPQMVSLIGRYKDELRERRFELASAEGMERIPGQESTADEFVGDAKCKSCHAQAYDVGIHAAHYHALQTLVDKKSEFDPECLSCHTVGYGLHSGYVDFVKTPNLANVQCESCHGRGKDHAATMRAALANPKLLATARKSSNLKAVTAATCIRCHDAENSENFRYSTFWAKIRH